MGESKDRPSLVVLSRPLSGARFVFEDGEELFIGSNPSCRFYLNLPQVSPFHARFRVERDALVVFDTQSASGVWVNDDRVVDHATVRSGEVVWLGPPGGDNALMMQYWHPPGGIEVAAPAAPADDALQETIIDAAPPDVALPPPTVALERMNRDAHPAVETMPVLRVEDPPTEVMRIEELDLETQALEVVEDEPELVATPIESPLDQTLVDVPAEATVTVQRPHFPEPAVPPTPPIPLPETPTVMMAAPIVAPATPAAPVPKVAPPAPEPPKVAPPAPPAKVAPPASTRPRAPAPAPASRAAAPAPRPAAPTAPAPAPRRQVAPSAPPVARETSSAPEAPVRSGSKAPLFAGLGFLALLAIAAAAWMAMRGGPGTDTPPVTVASGPAVPAVTNPPGSGGVSAVPRRPKATGPAVIEEVETVVPGGPPPTQPVAPGVTPATLPRLPSVTAIPTPVPPASGPAPTLAPAGPSAAEQAMARADAAVAAGQYDEAISAYDEALQLDSQQARATSGKAAALSLRKTFVPTASKFVGRPKKGVPAGFEGGEADPAYAGRIEWEFSPSRVKPGDPVSIRAFLVNDGTKEIDVETIALTTIIDGSRATGPTAPARRVAPRQRVLLGELSSTWKDGVKAWILEARAVSKRDDAYWSRVTWR